MSIEQLNTTALGATDVTLMAAAIDKNSKGLAQITVSEYDTDAACVVKVGSVFECNGATFLVSGTDETPTGYDDISVSTTFYLYYDESEDEFTYSETAPTWSDSLQGWYDGNDRALFSMYKDSTGLLYENKYKIEKRLEYRLYFSETRSESLTYSSIYNSFGLGYFSIDGIFNTYRAIGLYVTESSAYITYIRPTDGNSGVQQYESGGSGTTCAYLNIKSVTFR
jgi:hypothetical protein